MTGITRYGSYLPYFRLQRRTMGSGKGERTAASFDEDAVTLAVEAGREALADGSNVDTLIFATLSPPYAEKLNAATIQAALDLPETVRTLELGSSSRMGLAALLLGADLAANGAKALVCAGDLSTGAPGGSRESIGGDGGSAFVFGGDAQALAKIIGRASSTMELTDTWRLPQDAFPCQWEERFGAEMQGPAAAETAQRALADAGIVPGKLTSVILDAANPRAVRGIPVVLGLKPEQLADPLLSDVGRTGTSHAGLLLARALDLAKPGDCILVLSAADGCDALVLEVTKNIAKARPPHSVDQWRASKSNDLPYNSYLKWRGILPFEPPRRPDPDRAAAPPSRRAERWKMAFVGSSCKVCGTVHLPPQRACVKCGTVDEFRSKPLSRSACRVATYTLDHLAYSLHPPVVAAIVDFDGGGRIACELTDIDPADAVIGLELELTFRRLYTSQGIHNYFWKARPRR
jgi:hydroxymethylglutaryl-CoA synthase